MLVSLKVRRYWQSIRLDKKVGLFGPAGQRSFTALIAICMVAYLLWLLLSYFFRGLHGLFSSSPRPLVLPSGTDAFKNFAGSQECNIFQSDIYLTPLPTKTQTSPFCKNRATLLEALSNGGRHGNDEPFAGKDCTSHWYDTPELCMVLERFNALVFVGDDIAQGIYLAFNMLLREDLVLGGLQDWSMTEQDRGSCRCDKQFLDGCLEHGIRSSTEIKQSERRESPYLCDRIPHAYIPVNTVPTSATSIKLFKDLTHLKPNPWQPSPVVFSFGHASSFDIEMTTEALDEWLALALAAERNVPLLFLSPPAIGSAENNVAPWQYHQRMSTVAKEKHVDVLGLYNLTLQASTADGEHFGENVALAEAMMIINWLSKLETS